MPYIIRIISVLWLYSGIVICGYICMVLWYYSMIYVWCMIVWYHMYMSIVVYMIIWLYEYMNICDMMCCIMWDCKCGYISVMCYVMLWFQYDIYMCDMILCYECGFCARCKTGIFACSFEYYVWLYLMLCYVVWYL